MKLNLFKKIKLPDKPGVYFFTKSKNPHPWPLSKITILERGRNAKHEGVRQDDILYIGKATSLKDRTKSYFSKDLIQTRGPIIVDMVFKADSIKWQETDSVLEALILEANLIKKHQPYYNTKEKDDKSFNYVCLTKDVLLRILIVRGRNLIKENYTKIYGPFPNGAQLKTVLELIRKIFPFLDEKSRIKGTYEFYRQIKLVPEKNEILLKNIKNIKLLFEGKKKSILKSLEKEMKSYAKGHEFEKASEIKRQLFALSHINDIAMIKVEGQSREQNFSSYASPRVQGQDTLGAKNFVPYSAPRIEAYDIAHMSGKNMVGVMVVLEDGEVNKNEYRKFKIRTQSKANDTGALREVIERRLAHKEWAYPNLIVVDGNRAQINVAMNILKKNNLSISVVSVIKDDRHKAKEIMGNISLIRSNKQMILLANSEAHRFAITYHKNMRVKNFLLR